MPKQLILLLMVVGLSGCDRPSDTELSLADWQAYRSQFVSPEGRVVDTGNAGISHSEGQGYGMLLAVAAGDRMAFDQLWRWTQKHLQIRDDELFAWKWLPNSPKPVPDRNNASDGDLLIAWALSRAAHRWTATEYADAARAIARDIRHSLIVSSDLGPVLLPGQSGFDTGAVLTLNLSYWVFPALHEMQRLDGDPIWGRLQSIGWELIRRSEFGEHRLPPDWITLNGKRVALSESLSARFGFDAVRLPLYSCWFRQRNLSVLEQIHDYWSIPEVPAWIDLRNGQTATYGLTSGQQHVRELLARCLGKTTKKPFDDRLNNPDYYSATLALLTKLAEVEGDF